MAVREGGKHNKKLSRIECAQSEGYRYQSLGLPRNSYLIFERPPIHNNGHIDCVFRCWEHGLRAARNVKMHKDYMFSQNCQYPILYDASNIDQFTVFPVSDLKMYMKTTQT